MKELHIIAAIVALLAGFLAAFAAKGSRLHRTSGLAFVLAMSTMTLSALVSAAFLRPNAGNVVASLLAFYLVATGWITVHPIAHARGVQAALVLVGIAVGIAGITLGNDVLGHRVLPDGIPGQPLIAFGIVALVASAFDLRLLRGTVLAGAPRLMRHLWRMLLALWIATGSGFLGQAKFLPAIVVQWGLNLLPLLVVTALLVYWPIRVKRQQRRAQGARVPRARAMAAGPS